MKTIWAADKTDLCQALAGWTALRIFGKIMPFGPCCAMGVRDGEKLVAAMIYHHYDPDAGIVEISGAAESAAWLKRPVLYEMFSHPFDTLGCQTVFMRVAPENGGPRGLHRILPRLGFVSTILPRMRGRDMDDVLFTLTEEAWRSNGYHRLN